MSIDGDDYLSSAIGSEVCSLESQMGAIVKSRNEVTSLATEQI